MGWIQKCCETYDNNLHKVGIGEEGKALCPLYFIYKKADISITLREDGSFYSANKPNKAEEKTLIPITEKSSVRSSGIAAHPLCDELGYLAFGHPNSPVSEKYAKKYEAYHELLAQWADHPQHSHYIVQAVRRYIERGTIVEDLCGYGLLERDGETFTAYKENEKLFVRWQVIKAGEVGGACWSDQTLFESYAKFNDACLMQGEKRYCYATGEYGVVASLHPKGIVSAQNGAKLLSANDAVGYTYRGRFCTAEEAYVVTATVSQKAHSALRWLVANQGNRYGERTFVMWNSLGLPVAVLDFMRAAKNEDLSKLPAATQTQYRKQLRELFDGYRKSFEDVPDKGVQVIALDAATTGRMSITYYSEMLANDFFDRIEAWYRDFCWWRKEFEEKTVIDKVSTPSPYRLITFAFGLERSDKIEVDDAVLGGKMQELMSIILEGKKFPYAYVKRLVDRCSVRTGYSGNNYETLLFITCATIKKYYADMKEKEVSMQLDTNETSRSYLFGRLLAIAEKIERSGLGVGEDRMTNAERLQAAFVQRPMATWQNLELSLKPYLARMNGGLRGWFQGMLDDVFASIDTNDTTELNKPLKEDYLLGYHLQRKELNTRKENKENKE